MQLKARGSPSLSTRNGKVVDNMFCLGEERISTVREQGVKSRGRL